eukprot:8060699-Ditylum_brightwellii.AAC.1
MRWAQLCTGVSKPLLQKTGQLRHLEGKWLRQLCKDLNYIDRQIHLIDVWIPPPQQENDRWLMDEFLDSNLFSQLEL